MIAKIYACVRDAKVDILATDAVEDVEVIVPTTYVLDEK